MTFRLAPLVLAGVVLAAAFPAYSPAYAQDAVAECDRLAGNPDDPNLTGPGVLWVDIDTAAAEAACRAAVAVAPAADMARMHYQLARALDRADKLDESRKEYEIAGAAGYAPAWVAIGYNYETGIGVAQNYDKAVEFYRRAAEAGDLIGIGNLGNMYEQGWGVAQDYAEAARLYRQGAERGDAWAQGKLGYLYDAGLGVAEDNAAAAEWYRQGAEGGDNWSQYNLGYLYDVGEGVPQDVAEARRWYLKAAAQGNQWAKFNIGQLYVLGRAPGLNGKPDDRLAEKWFREAMVGTDTEMAARAMNSLAWNFALRGVNLDEAATLAEQAVQGYNDPTVLDTLGWVYYRQGRYDEAVVPLEQAVAGMPDFAPFHDHLGDVYAALGRTKEARGAWKRALELPAPDEDPAISGYDPEATRRKLAES